MSEFGLSQVVRVWIVLGCPPGDSVVVCITRGKMEGYTWPRVQVIHASGLPRDHCNYVSVLKDRIVIALQAVTGQDVQHFHNLIAVTVL